MQQLTLYDPILYEALAKIANYGDGNPNRPWVRALHMDLIHIAEEALDHLEKALPAYEGEKECLTKAQPSS